MIKRSLAAVMLAVVSGAVLIASTPGTAFAAPTAITSYSFTSEPGDYIGGGRSATYRAPEASITLRGTLVSLTVDVQSGADRWSINLIAPRGDQMRPGIYRDAERASFRTGRSPGLDVAADSRGCNQIWGQFTINQIAADAAGTVTMLDADFVQRCEAEAAPRLVGTVRINAYPLSYRMVSDPGDFVGQGVTKSYTNSTSLFTVGGSVTYMNFSVSGRRDNWRGILAPPTGQKLQVGTYPNAGRFGDATRAGLDVFGNGRGCNSVTGSFTIHELVADASGTVQALHLTFEQHCEGGAPALRGTFRYLA